MWKFYRQVGYYFQELDAFKKVMGFYAHFKGYGSTQFPSFWERMSANFVVGFCCYSCWLYRLHSMIICSLGEYNIVILEIWCTNILEYCIYTSKRSCCGSNCIKCSRCFFNTTYVPLSCDFITPRHIFYQKTTH